MKKTIKLILIIICMITIFCFSSDNSSKSTKKSDEVIITISNLIGHKNLTNKEKKSIIEKYVVPVRKSAHYIIYFILGILLISYLKEFNISYRNMILISICLALLYASSDEVHQLFVPGRSGQISDVLLDTFGSSCGVAIYSIIHKFRRKSHE